MKKPGRGLQNTSNLENDELEERQTQRKCDGKYELDADMFDLVVFEQLLHEEHNAAAKE